MPESDEKRGAAVVPDELETAHGQARLVEADETDPPSGWRTSVPDSLATRSWRRSWSIRVHSTIARR